jgi:hypothetical protein
VIASANFADPSFEPTDEQLNELSREAFGHVDDEAARALLRFHDEIRRLREHAIDRVGLRTVVESA